MLDAHHRRRPFRVLAYVCLAAGAAILMADPTESIKAADQDLRVYWAGLLFVGSLLSIFGAGADKYWYEFIGLPVFGTAMGAFVAALFLRGTTGTMAFGCFLLAIVVVMASRWLDLWGLMGLSIRAERRRR